MTTEQVQKNKRTIEDTVEQFSKQKADDPLIRYWIERKKWSDESQKDEKKRRA